MVRKTNPSNYFRGLFELLNLDYRGKIAPINSLRNSIYAESGFLRADQPIFDAESNLEITYSELSNKNLHFSVYGLTFQKKKKHFISSVITGVSLPRSVSQF